MSGPRSRGPRQPPRSAALVLAAALAGCSTFDFYDGPPDATPPRVDATSHDGTVREAARDGDSFDRGADHALDTADGADAARASDAHDAALCTSPWQQTTPGVPCQDREVFTIVKDVGHVHILHAARGFGGDLALLYDAVGDAGATLTLALVDPVARVVHRQVSLAVAPSFDSAAIADDGHGGLAITYHAGSGGPVRYVAFDGGLEALQETVVAEAGTSLLAISAIPQAAPDAAVGPLGLVPGAVGIAWYPTPAIPGDVAISYLYLLSRTRSGWGEPEIYGSSEVQSDLQLQPNPQRGVVASSVTLGAQVDQPFEACVWQMAGHVSWCGFTGQLQGLSTVVGGSAVRMVYTYPDPDTGALTLEVASDTDGTYTFPLLQTLATFSGAAHGALGEPRAALTASYLVAAVAYAETNLDFQIDVVTWDLTSTAITSEHVTSLLPRSTDTPPMDLVIDAQGIANLVVADLASGAIVLARAVLPTPVDGG